MRGVVGEVEEERLGVLLFIMIGDKIDRLLGNRIGDVVPISLGGDGFVAAVEVSRAEEIGCRYDS